ncbi:MAG: hypothetical protein ACYCRE_05795 [Acidobacteriaceae bacterium]
MKSTILALCLLCLSLPSSAHKLIAYQSAKVISQDLDTNNAGQAMVPLGNMLFDVPITRWSNVVVVQAGDMRLTWLEVGRISLVLPVNHTIQFYRDGKWYIVLDVNRKKHKFTLVHAEARPAE